MTRIIIAAMGANGVIGRGEGMPWHVPEEYEQYIRWVSGQTVIMGRRSWDIFGRDLTTTENIVVSHSGRVTGALVVPSLELALARAAGTGRTVFIAGGASVYTQALASDWVDEMYLSIIHGDHTGDSYFPEWDQAGWDVKRREAHARYELTIWQRRR
ncbi:dihydrofolate reductase [Sorangium sp. So ce1151]|uniref:dihydrofolate reductase n=1 Tax=Sorangium sp. So ce1151 TaxID=3133332 RepID=UPI003F61224F